MDVALLTAIKNYYTGKNQTDFLNRCYELLKRYGSSKGFRQKTWWTSDFCKGQLASFFTNNQMALLGALPSPKLPAGDWVNDEMRAYCHEHFDAPALEDKELFFTWFTENICKPEVAQYFLDNWDEHPDIIHLKLFWSHFNDHNFEEFCDVFWRSMLPLEAKLQNPEHIKQYFPVPKSLTGGQDAVDTEVVQEQAVEVESQSSSASENSTDDDMKSPAVTDLPEEIVDMDMRFRETRDPDLCRQLAQALTGIDYLHAAADYYFELVLMCKSQDKAESAYYDRLLATARAEGPDCDMERLVQGFQKAFPQTKKLQTLDFDLAGAYEIFKDKSRWLPIFSAKREDFGHGWADQEKYFKTECNKVMAGNKLYALEYIHGAVELLPDSFTLLRNLAQTQSALKLAMSASMSYELVSRIDPSRKSAAEAKCRSVSCLIDAKLYDQAAIELSGLKKFGSVDRDEISRLSKYIELGQKELDRQLAQAEVEEPKDEVPASQTQSDVVAPIQSATPMQPVSTESHPTWPEGMDDDVPPMRLPTRLIGYVKRLSGFINFWPQYYQVDGNWYLLTDDQAKLRFETKGALNLRFNKHEEPSALKDSYPFVVVLQSPSQLRPTGNPNYTVCIDPKIGKEVQPLSNAGYVVAYPCQNHIDLTSGTDVTVTLGATQVDTGEDVLSNLDVVLAVEGGFAGPFRMLATANGQLYIPAVKVEALTAVNFWKQNNGKGVLPAATSGKNNETVHYQIALVHDKKLFTKGTIDLLSPEEVLRITLNKTSGFTTIADVKEFVRTSDSLLINNEARRARVLALLDKMPELENFSQSVQDAAIEAAVRAVAKEAASDAKPLTDAFVKAVAQSKNLKGLEAQLKQNEDEIRADYQARIQSAKTEFEKASRDIEKELKARQADLTKVETEIEKKEAFWKSEFESFVKAAKDQITEHRLSPYFDELTGVAAATGTVTRPCAEGEIDYGARAQAIVKSVPKHRLAPAELRNHIITAFQARRGYTHDEVVNLCVSLANNFLTIFAGDPGIGKTTACHVLGDVLGLSDLSASLAGSTLWDADAAKRFLQVPVERGWTSKRDFLGYFNPLTQKFSSPDKRRYEAFRLLDKEASLGKDKVLPFVFLLDEANLSSMEYYWADFMGFCGNDDAAKREIVLGDNEVIAIPDHLRFLATINVDDTTETLSPRLLDRAWIIRLPEPKFDTVTREGNEKKAVLWSDFQAAFGCPQGKTLAKVVELDPIYAEFKAAGVNVSMRSQRAIAKFVAAGESLFDGRRTTAVDYAIAQKLLPMIRASGALFHQRLEKLKGVCAQYPTTCAIIDSIMTRGENNLNFYQFF
ncbi:MAG: cell envelope integrity protein TolA [Sutterellaceae bacterium]|nr:cell envelope integrity protein TolA [Sutterellaceae bacterium]